MRRSAAPQTVAIVHDCGYSRAVFRASPLCLALCLIVGCVSACATTPTETKRPEVKLGEPSDDIDPEVIGTAVRNNSAHFQLCYEEGRQRNPEMVGRVEVRFAINPDGSVGQAMAVETSLPSKVTNCVVDAFYELKLPEQEAVVIAQYPMFFQPG